MRTKKSKVKLIPLGGLGEIGKNITAIEYEDEIIVIDCGLSFPDNEMYGIDLVIPDISYLLENREKVKGIFITHGHEDHIGALPYILKEINVPVYASKFTLSLIESKLIEFNMVSSCSLNEITLKEPIKTEHFACEFIRTCHSIADSCSLAITTPQGVIFHTGDFKIDYTPVDGEVIDLQRISEIGKRRVLLLMADSTNATREGFTISETIIGQNLTRLFRNAKGRVIVATFSSNVHRVQQVINSSITYGRKVAFSGRSMEKISQIAMDLGYLKVPKNTIIKLDDIHKYPDNKVTIITTGSQGEPMSALSRIASGSHKNIGLKEGDYIIISASPIPGNTKLITKLIDILISKGAEVIYDAMEEVHVSGHACREELKLIHSLIKPKYFVPVHGEYRHLKEHAELAKSLGMDEKNIFLLDNGDVLELTGKKAVKAKSIHTGTVYVDGSGVGDVGNIVLRDRKVLSQDGILTAVLAIDKESKEIISGPDIISRGFVYVKDSNDLLSEATTLIEREVENCLANDIVDWYSIKSKIKSSLGQFLYTKTKRKPMIIPVIVEKEQ
ncbi:MULTISPECIES: ribonuclease J [Clostridia]|uniref:Ribonuclease J n=2 Tax=Clostridia TaxID=186801 RepID=A0A8I0DMX1_9CLOT|nr:MULTISPECIES: ribonuclease J [Clostridia]MBC5639535.1 ribonuclease J [Clostridium lentum]MBC5653628.1 ribonuclease J [Blautia lenta]MEE0568371.1 ribonuclease J [Clostridium sp.]CDB74465.1 beta-lactamase domain protein [Clostridium sp. CAG:265]